MLLLRHYPVQRLSGTRVNNRTKVPVPDFRISKLFIDLSLSGGCLLMPNSELSGATPLFRCLRTGTRTGNNWPIIFGLSSQCRLTAMWLRSGHWFSQFEVPLAEEQAIWHCQSDWVWTTTANISLIHDFGNNETEESHFRVSFGELWVLLWVLLFFGLWKPLGDGYSIAPIPPNAVQIKTPA